MHLLRRITYLREKNLYEIVSSFVTLLHCRPRKVKIYTHRRITYEPPHGKPTICIGENKGADQLRGKEKKARVVKINKKKKKKKSKNCLVCMYVFITSIPCTLFAYAHQMDMLIHDFSRFNLGVGHCACCSVSLLFVGSANWMATRNVALPIDIGHCKMHTVLIMLLMNKNHRPQNLAS